MEKPLQPTSEITARWRGPADGKEGHNHTLLREPWERQTVVGRMGQPRRPGSTRSQWGVAPALVRAPGQERRDSSVSCLFLSSSTKGIGQEVGHTNWQMWEISSGCLSRAAFRLPLWKNLNKPELTGIQHLSSDSKSFPAEPLGKSTRGS